MRRRHKLKASLWDRFHDKALPEPNSGCWLWTGATKEKGYGVLGLGRREDGIEKAHRVAYRLYKCEPADQNVLHRCDVTCCVNPDHLFLGSLADNMQDCVSKGRNFVPDNRGERSTSAKLTAEDVLEIRRRPASYGVMAKRFGVSKSTIGAVVSGTNWSSL